MGILRFYLALCIVAAHSNNFFPWQNHNGMQAVQIFYLISGFYMAHITSCYNSSIEFYISRLIRIYIPYYFVLLIVIIISLSSGYILNFWGQLIPFRSQIGSNGFTGIALSTISNLTIFFQDWILFFKDEGSEGLLFTTNFLNSKAPLYQYLMIPQAWSVGVELTFYLFVPILNKRSSSALIIVLVTSLILRVFTYEQLNLNNDPWNYRFFPFELSIFIIGMLSNRVYQFASRSNFILNFTKINKIIKFAFGYLSLFTIIFFSVKLRPLLIKYIGLQYVDLTLYVIWGLFIPVIFYVFKFNKIDRYIGDLSYPVYLLHFMVIVYTTEIFNKSGLDINNLGATSSLITVILAILLHQYVLFPIDKKRHEIASSIAHDLVQRKMKPTALGKSG